MLFSKFLSPIENRYPNAKFLSYKVPAWVMLSPYRDARHFRRTKEKYRITDPYLTSQPVDAVWYMGNPYRNSQDAPLYALAVPVPHEPVPHDPRPFTRNFWFGTSTYLSHAYHHDTLNKSSRCRPGPRCSCSALSSAGLSGRSGCGIRWYASACPPIRPGCGSGGTPAMSTLGDSCPPPPVDRLLDRDDPRPVAVDGRRAARREHPTATGSRAPSPDRHRHVVGCHLAAGRWQQRRRRLPLRPGGHVNKRDAGGGAHAVAVRRHARTARDAFDGRRREVDKRSRHLHLHLHLPRAVLVAVRRPRP